MPKCASYFDEIKLDANFKIEDLTLPTTMLMIQELKLWIL